MSGGSTNGSSLWSSRDGSFTHCVTTELTYETTIIRGGGWQAWAMCVKTA